MALSESGSAGPPQGEPTVEAPVDALWVDVNLATMTPDGEPYGAVADAALAVRDGSIAWLGPQGLLPDGMERAAGVVHEGGGRWITPGLIDCHTHLLFGGDRSAEFEARLAGESYESIARRGGGIRSTVEATKAASDEALVAAALRRVGVLARGGVTTVEIKSGYGLEPAEELRLLRLIGRVAEAAPVAVRPTLLALHALPPGADRDVYVRAICEDLVPRAAAEGLARTVDAFLEGIAFTAEECARLFEAARAHGLDVRLHADQLSDGGGAALAARFGARSADHLEYANREGAEAMAAAGTAAVLLPGAFLVLGETRRPPVDAFREAGVAMAVATDANPGSSPLLDLRLAMGLACSLFGLTPEEALAGATRVAARVLGLEDRGVLRVGARADLAVWDVDHPRELAYWMGGDPLRELVVGGRPLRGADAAG